MNHPTLGTVIGLTLILGFLLGMGEVSAQNSDTDTDLSALVEQARAGGIGEEMLAELQSRAERRGLSDRQVAGLLQPAVLLAGEQMPADHVMQKIMEGLSKGVPEAQILAVVERMSSSTRSAAGVVDPWMRNEQVRQMIENRPQSQPDRIRNRMVRATSRALGQAISEDAVSQILSEVGSDPTLANANPDDIAAAIEILPDLMEGGGGEMAQALVVRALKGGFRQNDLQRLPMAVQMARRQSQIPASSVLQGVASQLSDGIPAKEVLQNLFKGNIGGGPPGSLPDGIGNRGGRGQGSGTDRGNN